MYFIEKISFSLSKISMKAEAQNELEFSSLHYDGTVYNTRRKQTRNKVPINFPKMRKSGE